MSETSDSKADAQAPAPIPDDLLEILVCPLGKEPLRLEEDRLVCTRCGASFAIEDGIPNLLIDDAVLPEGISKIEDLECQAADSDAAS